MQQKTMWGLKQISDNQLDGYREYIEANINLNGSKFPWSVFHTRAEAREYRDEHYGYIYKVTDAAYATQPTEFKTSGSSWARATPG